MMKFAFAEGLCEMNTGLSPMERRELRKAFPRPAEWRDKGI